MIKKLIPSIFHTTLIILIKTNNKFDVTISLNLEKITNVLTFLVIRKITAIHTKQIVYILRVF